MKHILHLLYIVCALCVLVPNVQADDVRGLEGGYVNDPDVMVAPNSYFAISSVYNGHRYYLGVDTVAAKSGTYQVTTYDAPCFAAMWRVGGLYSATGAVLDSKDYQRMYKSVYLLEKHTQEAWLTLSGDTKTTLSLATDSAAGTFFHSDKVRAAKGRYVEGSIYYYSDAMGMDTYRYLAYDALYGYNKVYSVPRPTSTMWATIWKRIDGDNLSCTFTPDTYSFGWSTTAENQTVVFRMRLEEGGIRFHSQYDGTEFYVIEPTITDDQATLNSRVAIELGWASTHKAASGHTNSVFHANIGDQVLMTTTGTAAYDSGEKKFNGTISSVGVIPVDLLNTNNEWVDHQDYLHVHMTYNYGGKTISSYDSVLVTRQIFHHESYAGLDVKHSPMDYMFPYASTTQTHDFTLSASYEAGDRYFNTFGTEVYSAVGEIVDPVNIVGRTNDPETVAAYKADGVTASDWIESVSFPTRNTIRVVARAYTSGTSAYRVAMIKYSYTYCHSTAVGDSARAENIIWVMQAPEDQSAAPIQFYHQTGKSGLPMVGNRSRQQVPELTYTYYVIPEIANRLPIHHDHWGFYRWYIYKQGTNVGRGISNNWDWTTWPTNAQNPPQRFGQINPVNSTWSRGLFEMSSKLDPTKATVIPAVQLNTTKLGGGATNISFDDTLAVDVSAYTDTLSKGNYATNSLTSLTEPTLSYRQLFAMRPAKESADIMANHRTGAAHYMQEESVLAPIGSEFQLQPYSPYKIDKNADEGNLQYVYYYNPNTNDSIDEKMGTTTGWAAGKVNEGASYNRVGLNKQTNTTSVTLNLITKTMLDNMATGQTLDVLMVNPLVGNGYVLGDRNPAVGTTITCYTDANGQSTGSGLQSALQTWCPNQSYYKLRLTKTGASTFTITCPYWLENGLLGRRGNLILNGEDLAWRTDSPTTITYSQYTKANNDGCVTGINDALLTLKMSNTQIIASKWVDRAILSDYYSNDPHIKGNNENINEAGNGVWCFYQIVSTGSPINHKEWGKWQRKVSGGEWKDKGDGWTGTELASGALSTSYSGAENEVVEYRLITQHFQLAHFSVRMRPTATQGPSTTAILPEETIEQDYDLLASFQLEEILGAPGTSSMISPFYHLQFHHTQFAYHYPVGTGDHQIAAAQRVTGSDILPAKGEYCVINKFEKAGDESYAVVEAGGGAEHGWMFCYNRATKPLVFIDFEYDRPACTDQNLVLVSNFCKPNKESQESPHVKAEYFGWDGSAWVKIFTYLTGTFTAAGEWYQLALPLRWSDIGNYSKYRCVGTLNGAEGAGAYVLFDRFRLLGTKSALTSFQKRVTCVDANDSIYILSRVDYTDSELPAGRVICYQFQKWDNSANGGAGGYVPMITSDYDSGTDTYTCRSLNTTEVYPGYYKVGMNREEAVTNPAFKSAVLNSDYGMIVIPENEYNPANSGTSAGWSTARSNAIDRIQQILGGDRSSYKNETGRIKTYSDIMTATTFSFNGHGKFYVNEGTNANPHWVMYIIVRVKASDSDNGSFRIAMNTVAAVDQKPNFSSASCSNERIVRVQGSVDMLVDGNDNWPNKDRATLTAEGNLIPANTTKTLSLRYNAPADAKEGTTTSCRFDLVRAFAFMDGYIDMTPEQQAAADLQWLDIYGCTVGDFQEAMNVFRAEDIHNPNRNIYNWNDVTKESFRWIDGYDEQKADSMYNLLNRLIVRDRLFEVGLSFRDIYLASNIDSYYYIRPIAASGTYTKLTPDGLRDTIVEGIICNAPIWLELHSDESPDSLRFGYDKKFGDSFMMPVIRATKTAANTALTVRVAAISDHAVIGWDSTHVVETNDPSWNPAIHSFRYTQDRIVQERLYSGYYKQDEVVTFRPVDAAHITRLNRTDCECLNYDASGTTYDPANPRAKDAAGTNVFIRPAASPISGCNEWHILPQTSDPDPKKRIPGYQVPNNFTLKAGYWYKFKTTFFNTGTSIPYNMGDNPSGANTTYFILAVVPDTVRWTPHYTDRTNYWNDDNNWTAVVNKTDFSGSLATVPLEDTRVIVEPLEDQSYLPVVNYDSLGLKEWGFKTATCKDILFKKHSQILGQEKLTYTGKAFIDVIINQGNWQTFSPALKNVYSGDIYIPETPANDKDFLPEKFEKGSDWGEYHNRTWPYAFYQAYYNSTVPFAFQNTDKDGALDTDTKSPKNSAEWVKTNVLDQPLTPGKAVALLGFGPTNVEGTELIVRLPKQETSYHYISRTGSGWTVGSEVSLSRNAFENISGNLEYDKATLGEADGVTYTLTNALESNVFFFGNPTMSLIDVYRLCEDNIDDLEHTGDAKHTYTFTTYNMRDGSTYSTETVDGPGKIFIAPQRAVGLIAASPRTTLNVKLKPSALVALSAGGELVHNVTPGSKKLAPARATADDDNVKKLYVAAANETNKGLYKAYITLGESATATRGFLKGEDAISLSSGGTYYNSTAFATPLSMYTIADNQPLMLDMRDSIFSVPLVFATLDTVTNSKGVRVWSKYQFDGITRLSFALEGNWDKALYLYDALTGDSLMIVNGLQVGVQTPQSDQIRYFINGGRRIQTPVVPDPVDPGVVTVMENVNGETNSPLNNNQSTIIYDILGRRMKVLGEYDLLQNVNLPTGVYILQRGNQTEKIVVR